MFTQCTSENAVFQQFDLWWVEQFVSRGIALTCADMGILLNLTLSGIGAAIVATIMIIHYIATCAPHRDSYGLRRKKRS